MSEAQLEFVLCEDTVFENQCEYRFICLDVFITTSVQYRFLFKSEYRFVPVEALREEIKIRLNHL